ncbi:type II 3-dehydroquinate dehydratase [Rickettsiales bacterium]|nr:type II 3-dehydroquinate dehydratase [Rickettsiales bacterium]
MGKDVLILNGPNLNMLGKREPEIYGSETLSDIEKLCNIHAKSLKTKIDFRQSNHEGELVEWIQTASENFRSIIINAGAYTHTSIAIRDALLACGLPVIELHMSNIYKREEFRQISYISDIAQGVICGFGSKGYIMAIDASKLYV